MAELAATGRSLRAFAARMVDIVYHASALSIFAYGIGLFFLVLIGSAVSNGVIDVPFIHAK